jgi:serine/threonine protein kinase
MSQSIRLWCRDLKGENILQSLNGQWVVCDFGSAQTIDLVPDRTQAFALEDLVKRTTTAAYRAPELFDVWSSKRINTKADIFVRSRAWFAVMVPDAAHCQKRRMCSSTMPIAVHV